MAALSSIQQFGAWAHQREVAHHLSETHIRSIESDIRCRDAAVALQTLAAPSAQTVRRDVAAEHAWLRQRANPKYCLLRECVEHVPQNATIAPLKSFNFLTREPLCVIHPNREHAPRRPLVLAGPSEAAPYPSVHHPPAVAPHCVSRQT
jgi:hypothetical protein